MSKFRKKRKAIAVNGKLPFLALFPALSAAKRCLGYNSDKSEITKALTEFSDGVYHKEDGRVFVSVIKSKKVDASVVKHGTSIGLAITTTGLVVLAEHLYKTGFDKNALKDDKEFVNHQYSTEILKLLDIALGVEEMDCPVIECEIEDAGKWQSYFGGYSGIPIGDRITGTSPYLSKRYEKHNLYSVAENSFSAILGTNDRVRWKQCLDKWKMDLEHFKDNHLPGAFVYSEILMAKSILSR